MAFSGAGPETINGRLAMLGFISALGAEAASGESIFQQVGDAEPSILFAFVMFAAASLIPIFKGVKKERFAIFSPEAEMLNGRAAMIGFALLIAIEAKTGIASVRREFFHDARSLGLSIAITQDKKYT